MSDRGSPGADADRRPTGRRCASALLRPWVLAAVACGASYGLLRALGLGRFRSEFLGASLAIGILGGLLLVAFRVFKGPLWLHALGAFWLHWLFAAYALSFLAV